MTDWYTKNSNAKIYIKNKVIDYLKSEEKYIFFDDIFDEIQQNPDKYNIGERTANNIIKSMAQQTKKFTYEDRKLTKFKEHE